jgi:hypothetical protein
MNGNTFVHGQKMPRLRKIVAPDSVSADAELPKRPDRSALVAFPDHARRAEAARSPIVPRAATPL